MNDVKSDIAVVGAGPAGSTAAIDPTMTALWQCRVAWAARRDRHGQRTPAPAMV